MFAYDLRSILAVCSVTLCPVYGNAIAVGVQRARRHGDHRAIAKVREVRAPAVTVTTFRPGRRFSSSASPFTFSTPVANALERAPRWL